MTRRLAVATLVAALGLGVSPGCGRSHAPRIRFTLQVVPNAAEASSSRPVEAVMSETIGALRARFADVGVADVTIEPVAEEPGQILVELPRDRKIDVGELELDSETLARGLFSYREGRVEWHLCVGSPAPTRETLLAQFGERIPEGARVMVDESEHGEEYILVEVAPLLTQDDVQAAEAARDTSGEPVVNVTISEAAADRINGLIEGDPYGHIAVVMDDQVLAYLRIIEPVGTEAVLRGFSPARAGAVALALNLSPASPGYVLPADLEVLEEAVLEPEAKQPGGKLLLGSCGSPQGGADGDWREVPSLEVNGQTMNAGHRVRIEPAGFKPAVFPQEFTVKTFVFEGELLDSSGDLVLVPTVTLFTGSGRQGKGMASSETVSNSKEPIHWSSSQSARRVEMDYPYMPGIGGSAYRGRGWMYFYLTDQRGVCVSNIVAWPATFE